MWKLVYGSEAGTSHLESGRPCQDHCGGKVVGTTLFAACSDGAGSAELSQLGSRVAVDGFLGLAAGSACVTAPGWGEVESWVARARGRVLEEASDRGVRPRELAGTFLGAVVGDDWAAFVQVGDGVIVFDGEDGYELAFWPDNGEYANTTHFLTDDDYRDHLNVKILTRRVRELAILTDGLQRLALDYATSRAHGPFFSPLFRTIRDGPGEETLRASLRDYLNSGRVNARTDDDKTLLLAARITPDVPPILPDPTP